MQKRSKIIAGFLLIAGLTASIKFLLTAPFGFSLSNVNSDSVPYVMLVQDNQLSLSLPKCSKWNVLGDFKIVLMDEKTEELINFKILVNYPPYPEANPKESYDRLLISTEPYTFERGNYSVKILKRENLLRDYEVKLRYEFTPPWAY